KYADEVPAAVADLSTHITVMREYYDIVPLTDSQVNLRWKACAYPLTVSRLVTETRANLERETAEFQDVQYQEQSAFKDHTASYIKEATQFANKHTTLDDVASSADSATRIQRELRHMEQQAKLFNSRERAFDQESTDYSHIAQVSKAFDSQAVFWANAAKWREAHEQWVNGAFDKIDAEQCEAQLEECVRNIAKAARSFKQVPQTLSLSQRIKEELNEFKVYMPLLQAMRTPGIQPRHWEKISETLGVTLRPDLDVSNDNTEELGYTFKQ
ncbi:dynein heavy chain 1, axonemal, partial [Kipferlia bialata]